MRSVWLASIRPEDEPMPLWFPARDSAVEISEEANAPRERGAMDIQTVVANVQRRKAEQAVNNELDLRAAQMLDVAFTELRGNLLDELTEQVKSLTQQGIVLDVNTEGDKTVVNRNDSGKTLTISFTPLFHRVSFNYDGGAAFKRTLTVVAHTISGLNSRERFTYRRDNGEVVQPKQVASFVGELLNTLLT